MIRRIALAALLVMAAGKALGLSGCQPGTRAMQDDDESNPGFLWVQQGEACGMNASAPRDVAARTAMVPLRSPAWRGDALSAVRCAYRPAGHARSAHRAVPCRSTGGDAIAGRSDALLGLTAYVGLKSRGLPMQVAVDGPARPFHEAGKALFNMREGQFNLACARCHDDLAGQRLAGSIIPQGHPTATRNIGWSGRARARWNAAFATARWASVPNRSPPIRSRWWNWSFISARDRTA